MDRRHDTRPSDGARAGVLPRGAVERWRVDGATGAATDSATGEALSALPK